MGLFRRSAVDVIAAILVVSLEVYSWGFSNELGSIKVEAFQFTPNYKDALSKTILFFEGQRSGKLPADQRMKWRSDSALDDGQTIGVDLSGGYYDAGDNVKFGFPMAFTTTILAWSAVEFSHDMGDEAKNAYTAIRWGSDYLLKASSQIDDNILHVQVGDPYSDHSCWERPEDMDTLRTVATINASKPGSEVAGETAAALAASSLAFKSLDHGYSQLLLNRAIQVFEFADKYRGSYNVSVGYFSCPFYCDFNGYMDELLWGAVWLYKATEDEKYWDYVSNNIKLISNQFLDGQFGWDGKHAAIYVLISKKLFQEDPSHSLLKKANVFVCQLMPESPEKAIEYSPGGLIYKGASNMQNPAALSLILLVFSRYLESSSRTVQCGKITIKPSRLVEVARSQADYMLGKNPQNMSYMVGYGDRFPQRLHHRGSSVPSIKSLPEKIICHSVKERAIFMREEPNPNLLVGAIVGGPNLTDIYTDDRALFNQTEPTTYINAPMVGVFAYFSHSQKK
ncbi:endo-beta-1,4-glucanase, family GH9 [Zostera marina]|uniref:Endoglucanase n=1 Tax=Zostera marina TaxID=29655 RepID=A0A0K9Q388_ZOSMR|nr:endo-beta-1,4-glucanase, family GH9 [Zostera marina]